MNKQKGRKIKKQKKIQAIICICLLFLLMVLVCRILCPQYTIVTYNYVSCETMWELLKYCPEKMYRGDFFAEIRKLNDMKDNTIYANKIYQIPIYE